MSELGKQVKYIVDGDTLVGSDGSHIRLADANAPETYKDFTTDSGKSVYQHGQRGGEAATRALGQMLERGYTSVDTGDRTYGRSVERVYDADGRDVSNVLIRNGLAEPTPGFASADANALDLAAQLNPQRFFDEDMGEFRDMRDADRTSMGSPADAPWFKRRKVDRSVGATASASFARGIDNTQASLYKAAEWFGDITDSKVVSDWGEAGFLQNVQEAATNPARVQSYEDVDSLADGWLYFVESLGEAAPQLLGDAALAATGAGAGAVVGRRVAAAGAMKALARKAGPQLPNKLARTLKARDRMVRAGTVKGAKRGAQTAFAASVAPQMMGESYRTLQEHDIDDPVHAILPAMINTGFEMFGVSKLLSLVTSGAKKEAIDSVGGIVKETLARGGKGLGVEGITELSQSLVNEIAVKAHLPDHEIDWTGIIDAGIRGAIVGGTIGGVGGATQGTGEFNRSKLAGGDQDEGANNDVVLPPVVGPQEDGGSGATEQPFTSEPAADVKANAEDLLDPKTTRSAVVTTEENVETATSVLDQAGVDYQLTKQPDHAVKITVDPAKATVDKDEAERAASLGIQFPKPELDPENTVAVQAVKPDGSIPKEQLVPADQVEAVQAQMSEEYAHTEAEVTVRPVGEAMDDRAARVERERAAQATLDATLAANAKAKAQQQPEAQPTIEEATGQPEEAPAVTRNEIVPEEQQGTQSIFSEDGKTLIPREAAHVAAASRALSIESLKEALSAFGISKRPVTQRKRTAPLDRLATIKNIFARDGMVSGETQWANIAALSDVTDDALIAQANELGVTVVEQQDFDSDKAAEVIYENLSKVPPRRQQQLAEQVPELFYSDTSGTRSDGRRVSAPEYLAGLPTETLIRGLWLANRSTKDAVSEKGSAHKQRSVATKHDTHVANVTELIEQLYAVAPQQQKREAQAKPDFDERNPISPEATEARQTDVEAAERETALAEQAGNLASRLFLVGDRNITDIDDAHNNVSELRPIPAAEIPANKTDVSRKQGNKKQLGGKLAGALGVEGKKTDEIVSEGELNRFIHAATGVKPTNAHNINRIAEGIDGPTEADQQLAGSLNDPEGLSEAPRSLRAQLHALDVSAAQRKLERMPPADRTRLNAKLDAAGAVGSRGERLVRLIGGASLRDQRILIAQELVRRELKENKTINSSELAAAQSEVRSNIANAATVAEALYHVSLKEGHNFSRTEIAQAIGDAVAAGGAIDPSTIEDTFVSAALRDESNPNSPMEVFSFDPIVRELTEEMNVGGWLDAQLAKFHEVASDARIKQAARAVSSEYLNRHPPTKPDANMGVADFIYKHREILSSKIPVMESNSLMPSNGLTATSKGSRSNTPAPKTNEEGTADSQTAKALFYSSTRTIKDEYGNDVAKPSPEAALNAATTEEGSTIPVQVVGEGTTSQGLHVENIVSVDAVAVSRIGHKRDGAEQLAGKPFIRMLRDFVVGMGELRTLLGVAPVKENIDPETIIYITEDGHLISYGFATEMSTRFETKSSESNADPVELSAEIERNELDLLSEWEAWAAKVDNKIIPEAHKDAVNRWFFNQFNYDQAQGEALLTRADAILEKMYAGDIPVDMVHSKADVDKSVRSAQTALSKRDTEALSKVPFPIMKKAFDRDILHSIYELLVNDGFTPNKSFAIWHTGLSKAYDKALAESDGVEASRESREAAKIVRAYIPNASVLVDNIIQLKMMRRDVQRADIAEPISAHEAGRNRNRLGDENEFPDKLESGRLSEITFDEGDPRFGDNHYSEDIFDSVDDSGQADAAAFKSIFGDGTASDSFAASMISTPEGLAESGGSVSDMEGSAELDDSHGLKKSNTGRFERTDAERRASERSNTPESAFSPAQRAYIEINSTNAEREEAAHAASQKKRISDINKKGEGLGKTGKGLTLTDPAKPKRAKPAAIAEAKAEREFISRLRDKGVDVQVKSRALKGSIEGLMRWAQRALNMRVPTLIVTASQLNKDSGVYIPQDTLRQLQANMRGKARSKTGAFFGAGEYAVIVLPETKNANAMVFLAHELGHAFYTAQIKNMPYALRKSLHDTFVKSEGKDFKKEGAAERFDEWVADQVAHWLGNRSHIVAEKENISALGKIAERLFALWAKLKDSLLQYEYAGESFDQFMREALNTKSAKQRRITATTDRVMNMTTPRATQAKNTIWERAKSTWRNNGTPVIDTLARSTHKRIYKLSPTLANMLYQESVARNNTTERAYEQDWMVTSNRWRSDIERAEEDIAGKANALNKKKRAALLAAAWSDLRNGRDTAGSRALRRVVDKFNAEAQKKVPTMYFRRDFIPEAFNHEALESKRVAFEAEMSPALGISLSEAHDMVTMMLNTDGTNIHSLAPGKAVSMHANVNRILSNKALHAKATEMGLFHDKPNAILHHYAESLAKRSAWEHTFGGHTDQFNGTLDSARAMLLKSMDVDISKFKSVDAAKKYAERIGIEKGGKLYSPNAKLHDLLNKVEAEKGTGAKKELLGLIDSGLGRSGQSIPAGIRNTQDWMMTLTNLTVLSMSGIASIPEIGGGVIRGGQFVSMKEALSALANISGSRGLATEIGSILTDGSEQAQLESMGAGYQSPMQHKINYAFFKLNGQQAITRLSRAVSTGIGVRFFRNAARAALKGDASAKKELSRFHVTAEQINAWEKEGRPRDVAVYDALNQFVYESTIRPSRWEAPSWGNNAYLKAAFHLKQFFYSFGKVVLGGIARQTASRYRTVRHTGNSIPVAGFVAAAPMLTATAVLLPLAAAAQELREEILDSDRTAGMDSFEYGKTLFSKAGGFGPFEVLANMHQAQEFGRSPLAGFVPTYAKAEFLMSESSTEAKIRSLVPFFSQSSSAWKTAKGWAAE